MRYRIVIEIEVDVEAKRAAVNRLAHSMLDLSVTKWSNPAFLSTEQVLATEEVQVLRQTRA